MNEWYDIPSEEMTLEQAQSAVRELRKKVAEQFAKTQNEWVSVNDRLPEKEGTYIGVIDETRYNPKCIWVSPVKYLGGSCEYKKWWWISEKQYTANITYWMPLPNLRYQRSTTMTDDYFKIVKDGDHKTEHLIITLECPKCGCRVAANSKSKKLKMDKEECRITYSCECPCCNYTMYDIDRKSVRI